MHVVKEIYVTKELANILGCSVPTLLARAAKEHWPSVERQGRGGGKEYPYATLPEYVKRRIIAHTFNTEPKYIHDVELPLDRLKEQMAAFEGLDRHYKDVAIARFDVLELCQKFIETNGMKTEKGRAAFVDLYKKSLAPGVGEDTYKLVSSCSVPTIFHWVAAFKNKGLIGLAPDYTNNGRPLGIVTDLALIVEAALAETPHISDTKLHQIVLLKIPKGQRPPHRTTIHRHKKRWLVKYGEEYALAKNPKHWKNTYLPAMGTLATAPYAGHTWELDSTVADVMTSDGRRCAIVAAIDVYSRRVVVIVAETSTSDAVAACIRKGLLAWGKPEVIRKDNGKDYASAHILAITSALKIETPKIQPYTPEGKGHIERFLRTLSGVFEHFPLYTGHGVEDRAAERERQVWDKRALGQSGNRAVDIPLSMAELLDRIEQWIKIYENQVHSGFANDPDKMLKGLTPRQAFELSKRKPSTFKDERSLDILLAKVGEYKVHKSGLRVRDGRYVAPELVDLIGQYVTVKIDPDDAGALYVFYEGKYFCIARDEALEGEKLADYLERKKSKLKKLRTARKAAKTLSENMDVSYTSNLVTGKLYDVLAVSTPPQEVMDFRPEYDSEEVREAKAAAAAYEGKAPVESAELGKILKLPVKRYIHPKPTDLEISPAYPYEATKDALKFFEFLMDKNDSEGLTNKEVERVLHLWDHYREVKAFHQRPDEARLSVIQPLPPLPDNHVEVHL